MGGESFSICGHCDFVVGDLSMAPSDAELHRRGRYFILSPGVFVTFGKVAYFFAIAHPEPDPPLAPLFEKAAPSTEPRVIWIIYDELDERVAVSKRPKDCPLPELDSVCAESLQATNAFPPGGSTTISLPALTISTGRYVVKARPASRSEMDIAYPGTDSPVGSSTQPTIFSQARALGYNTALVGWYHPYSRLFPSSLNYCAWYPFSPVPTGPGAKPLPPACSTRFGLSFAAPTTPAPTSDFIRNPWRMPVN